MLVFKLLLESLVLRIGEHLIGFENLAQMGAVRKI